MTGSRSSRDIVSRPAAGNAPGPTTSARGRLVAVVVGIDRYEDAAVPDLTCAVNDAESISSAICQTQPADALELALLTAPAREAGAGCPTWEGILEASRQAAASAGAQDTVLFYFAGHGGMLQGRPCLFPGDVRLSEGGTDADLQNAISVDELQKLFEGCPSKRRVMFLDCCQNAFSGSGAAEQWQRPGNHFVGRAVPWRTGMPLAAGLIDAFQQLAQGWSLVVACGPNEVSLEDPEWGAHGIFSHFLATGLRGEADLDRDGVVSLPELVQYLGARVPKQAEAIFDELRGRGGRRPPKADRLPP